MVAIDRRNLKNDAVEKLLLRRRVKLIYITRVHYAGRYWCKLNFSVGCLVAWQGIEGGFLHPYLHISLSRFGVSVRRGSTVNVVFGLGESFLGAPPRKDGLAQKGIKRLRWAATWPVSGGLSSTRALGAGIYESRGVIKGRPGTCRA